MTQPSLPRSELLAFLESWGHHDGPERLDAALAELGWGAKEAFDQAELHRVAERLSEAALHQIASLTPSPERDHVQALFQALHAHALPMAVEGSS